MKQSLREQWENRYAVDPDRGCWLWTGTKDHGGYGRLQRQGAHRLGWIFTHGPIPDELNVCHHCDIRHCVNPQHLFLGTQAENMRDRDRKGRQKKPKAFCRKGHAMSGDNLYIVVVQSGPREGQVIRICKTCKRVYNAQWAKRQKPKM